ncbi:MAG TPA: twin transmembrane helix small protein [Burkholderiales bacterium]|nr:twin transmembrane helix small protein [Burkholderiales bacterium]
MIVRVIVFLFIAVILFSLGSALYYLIKDKGQSERTVKALTVRITFSIVLFLILMLGFYFGLISPQGL